MESSCGLRHKVIAPNGNSYHVVNNKIGFSHECISSKTFHNLRKKTNEEARSQEVEWEELNDKVTRLYQQDRFSKAILAGKEALKVAENTFGAVQGNVATAMNNLALLYTPRLSLFMNGQ